MPLLAKGDQGVLTRVCQNGIELRDSVDDEDTNEARTGAQLMAFPRRHLLCFCTSEIETWCIGSPGRIDRTCFLARCLQGPCALLTGGIMNDKRQNGGRFELVLRQSDLHLVPAKKRSKTFVGMDLGSCEAPNTDLRWRKAALHAGPLSLSCP